MEINIHNYTNIIESRGIKEGDSIIFVLKEGTLVYTVETRHLQLRSKTAIPNNALIFQLLEIDKSSFAEKIYGYKPCGDFPEWNCSAKRDAIITSLFTIIAAREQGESLQSAKHSSTELESTSTFKVKIPKMPRVNIKL